ncbi:reverse transcriptase/maturase family protein [Francisella sciaenopsi]|uniref:Reverse transcriptase domain-containing protein n=1 Tax=Francisella sciaenopsi TaxID=3055034 RepID=A0ABQ6PFL4_9GAMM
MIAIYLDWLKQTRKHWSHNDSYWDFRSKLAKTNNFLLVQLQYQINTTEYSFSPGKAIIKTTGDITTLYDAKDSLVLKYIAENIKNNYTFNKYILSNKGNGGVSRAVKTINRLIKTHKYIYRTDVKKFYESINHEILISKLPKYTSNIMSRLIIKHLDTPQWFCGEYNTMKQGISKSSPLSPVLGCIYLDELDQAMSEMIDIKYLRYADDWIILAKTKHKLRKAVKKSKQMLSKLKLKEHPDKLTIETISFDTKQKFDSNNKLNSKPFAFLGVEFDYNGAKDIKKQTKRNFFVKISRLYECIQQLAKAKAYLNKENAKGKRLYDYINLFELEVIKKFTRSLIGFRRYIFHILKYAN